MKIAIMQPYLFPYLGYFQLVAAADVFVLYDDVAFSSGGWINRNRLLDPVTGNPFWITVPVRAGKRIDETEISGPPRWRDKLLRRIAATYAKAPHFDAVWPLLENAISNPEPRLAPFLLAALKSSLAYLGLRTPLVDSSTIYDNRELTGRARVLDITRREKAETYLNAEGGRVLYEEEDFATRGLRLQFLEHIERPYPQLGGHPFVPRLSILDAMMQNPPERLRELLSAFHLHPPRTTKKL